MIKHATHYIADTLTANSPAGFFSVQPTTENPFPSFPQLHFPEHHFKGKRIRVLKGKWRGAKFTVHQSANDWITVIPPNNPRYRHLRGGYIILDPKNVEIMPSKVSRSKAI